MGIFEDRESAVRSYCRTWPKIFDRAAGSWLYDADDRAAVREGCLWKSTLSHLSLAR